MKVYGQLERAQAELLASDPSASLPGRLLYNTTDSKLRYDDGSVIRTLLNTDEAQTLTNKTISGASNTLTVRDDDIDSEVAVAGQVLTADGASGSSWTTPSQAPNHAYHISNLGIAASVAANALTIEMKIEDGSTDPSVSNKVRIAFRDATITSGAIVTREQTSALSGTIPSGDTLGHRNGEDERVYVYAIDNSGVIKLGFSACNTFLESELHTTVALGSGSPDRSVLYSDAVYSNVAIRLLGYIGSNQATAGTWASSPTEIYIGFVPPVFKVLYEMSSSTANPQLTFNTFEVLDFDTRIEDTHDCVTTGVSWQMEAKLEGWHEIIINGRLSSSSGGVDDIYQCDAFVDASSVRKVGNYRYQVTGSVSADIAATTEVYLTVGQLLDIRGFQNRASPASINTNNDDNNYVIISYKGKNR